VDNQPLKVSPGVGPVAFHDTPELPVPDRPQRVPEPSTARNEPAINRAGPDRHHGA
jgi:hypothetical protein